MPGFISSSVLSLYLFESVAQNYKKNTNTNNTYYKKLLYYTELFLPVYRYFFLNIIPCHVCIGATPEFNLWGILNDLLYRILWYLILPGSEGKSSTSFLCEKPLRCRLFKTTYATSPTMDTTTAVPNTAPHASFRLLLLLSDDKPSEWDKEWRVRRREAKQVWYRIEKKKCDLPNLFHFSAISTRLHYTGLIKRHDAIPSVWYLSLCWYCWAASRISTLLS